MCSVYDVYKRFGRWDQMLAEPPPPDYMPFTLATWHAHRAISYAAKKEFDAAIRRFLQVVKINPRHFDALNYLGVYHMKNGDHGPALPYFQRAAAARPRGARE